MYSYVSRILYPVYAWILCQSFHLLEDEFSGDDVLVKSAGGEVDITEEVSELDKSFLIVSKFITFSLKLPESWPDCKTSTYIFDLFNLFFRWSVINLVLMFIIDVGASSDDLIYYLPSGQSNFSSTMTWLLRTFSDCLWAFDCPDECANVVGNLSLALFGEVSF